MGDLAPTTKLTPSAVAERMNIVPPWATRLAMQASLSAWPRPTVQKPSLLGAESSAAAGPAANSTAANATTT